MKRTLLFIVSWTLCTHPMDKGLLQDDRTTSANEIPLHAIAIHNASSTASPRSTAQANQDSQPHSKKWRYAQRAICCSVATAGITLAAIGAAHIYNNLSSGVLEMRDSCDAASNQLKGSGALLEEAHDTFDQAKEVLTSFAEAAPILAELQNLTDTLRPLLTLVQYCRNYPSRVFAVVQALCPG